MINHENDWLYEIREFDRDIYRRVLPAESPLLDALDWIPWESFIPELESYYSANEGTPSIPPLIMLKLELLKYLYRLSDRGGRPRT